MSDHTDPRSPLELPVSTALGHRARVGDEVQFSYTSDASLLSTATATVVFVWPGDELDLDVKGARGRTHRHQHVRPHVGDEVRPHTWWT